MKKYTKLLKSRQAWTIIGLFVLSGFEGVTDLLPPGLVNALTPVLTIAALYFRANPKQEFPVE